MKKKSMALSTLGYTIVALFLLLVLTFIYFGHTGFFQKIYGITDKLGVTDIAKSVEDKEKEIEESGYELTEQEKKDEKKIRSTMDRLTSEMQSCLDGPECVCEITVPEFPDGYAMRFINGPDKKVYVSAFKFKEKDWNLDNAGHHQGETGVHFVEDATHKFKGTQLCLVPDLAATWFGFGSDVAKIDLRRPKAGMVNIYWEGDKLALSEATGTGWIFNHERDYRVYGKGGAPNRMYKTSDGRICFFAERWKWDDDKLIDDIRCGESEEKEI
ncbi:MAG: hypothetical protein R6U32_03630 [Candidatus Woesearchaeota archaeon]